MGLRRHDDEAHHRYRMQQKLISIGDDYWIEDDGGHRAYKVNGKAAHLVRETWKLEDEHGHTVAKIQEKKLSVRDKIKIELDGGDATVKKALVGIRDRFEIDVDHGHDMKAHGNVLDHEYKIERQGDTVAEISKRWFRVRDTYGIEVFDETATPLLLAITVAIDALAHDLV